MTAVQRRVSGWLEVFREFLCQADPSLPRARIADELAARFDSRVSWNWQDPDGQGGFELNAPIPGWPPSGVAESLPELLALHPLVRWYAASGDPAPMSIGRVPRHLLTPESTGVVREVLRPFDVDRQLSIPYRLGPGHYRAFVLARTGDDYSNADMTIAQHLHTLLMLLDRQCCVLRAWQGTSSGGLTGRELTILQLVAQGLTATAIGHRLGISPRTVHAHERNLYRKLGVNDRLRAVLAAQTMGVLPELLPDPHRG